MAGSRKNGGAKDDYERLTKTEHFICYEKRDISNVVRMGTFLMSVDKNARNSLTNLNMPS